MKKTNCHDRTARRSPRQMFLRITLVAFGLLLGSVQIASAVVLPPKPLTLLGLYPNTNHLHHVAYANDNNASFISIEARMIVRLAVQTQSGKSYRVRYNSQVEPSMPLFSGSVTNGWFGPGYQVVVTNFAGVSAVKILDIPVVEDRGFFKLEEVNTPPLAVIAISSLTELLAGTNVLVISSNNTDAEVALDGSQSSDVENDPLQYLWMEGTNVFATTVKTTKRFDLGRHTITLRVSDGKDAGVADATLAAVRASGVVGMLMALVDETNIGSGNRRPLLASLEAASASFERGNMISGVNQLQAFQNMVKAQIVPSNQAATNLIQAAEEIILAMANSGDAEQPHLVREGRL